MGDQIQSPDHYTHGGIEVIDFIVSWNMEYHQGNIIKYICRYKYKGTPVEDLKKARQYLDWLIEEEELSREDKSIVADDTVPKPSLSNVPTGEEYRVHYCQLDGQHGDSVQGDTCERR